MKGVVFPGDRRADVQQFADPRPSDGEVVVQIRASGLCGSDLHLYRQTAQARLGNRTIPGHEPSGVVVEVGSGVTNVKPGDRVSVYHYRGCGHCRHCLAGNMMWCNERRGYGGPIHGSHAELLLTDERNCLPLPGELSFADGAMIACAAGTAFASMRKLYASGDATPAVKSTVLIFGLGPVGLSGVLIAQGMGSRVIGVEPRAERRQLAHDLGADVVLDPNDSELIDHIKSLTQAEGASMAFETSGSAEGRKNAVDALGLGGKAVFVGFGTSEKTLNLSQIIGRQLTLMGSFVMPIYMYWDLVDFILDHGIDLESMVTHRFSLDAAEEAFKLFDLGRTGKVIFEPEGAA